MLRTLQALKNDEAGFIVSAELVLVGTIVVVGMIVGLSEVQHSVVQELNDVGEAIGKLNQTYCYSGFSAQKTFGCGIKSKTVGSVFIDVEDDCDCNQCDITCDYPVPEPPKFGF